MIMEKMEKPECIRIREHAAQLEVHGLREHALWNEQCWLNLLCFHSSTCFERSLQVAVKPRQHVVTVARKAHEELTCQGRSRKKLALVLRFSC